MTGATQFELEGLCCRRGGRELFAGLTLSLAAGAFLSVEGPNGAGKTSLLRLAAGLLTPSAGTIRIRTGSGAVLDDAEDRSRMTGWLGHQDGVKARLTVREQLDFWAGLYGCGAALPDRFGLEPLAALPGQVLSAGEKRRLALARLVLSGRPLWLLDEPLASLDTAAKGLVIETVRAHCAAGGIVLAATHEPLGIAGPVLRLGAA